MPRNITDLVGEHIKSLSAKQPTPPKTEDAIRLDKGELPYPPSPIVVQAIAQAASTINRYPEILGGSLREKLAAYTGAKPNQIIINNGSDDAIELILKVFVQPGDEVILPIPTFFIYDFATKSVGGIPINVHRTEDFGLDVEAILAKVTPRTKVLFIANPNNPTANLVPREILVDILNRIDCLVVVDECYYEFCQETIIDLLDSYPHLIILRSLSKSFGLAGIRVGYGIASETIIDYLYRAAQLFPVNKLALVAGNAALDDQAYITANIEQIKREKQQLIAKLQQLGLVVYPSATNFIFVSSKPLGISSRDLLEFLKTKNVFLADFGLKQGLDDGYFRISVGTTRENQVLLEKLSDAIALIS